MPQKIICEGCGYVLYDSDDLKPPEELIKELEGKCPKCSKKLIFNPEKVEIKGLTNR